MKIFKLPDLGEGLPDAEIVEWHVKVGDLVKLDQRLISMETAKAVVEVPSPLKGRVVKLYGKPNDIIKTGDPLVEFEEDVEVIQPTTAQDSALDQDHSNLSMRDAATVAGKLEIGNTILQKENPFQSVQYQNVQHQNRVRATPAVRALAKRLQVELSNVSPTGPNGTLTTQDIEEAAKLLQNIEPLEPLKGARRTMAYSMSQAHAEVVPVTLMEDAQLVRWSPTEDITVRLIQAIITACKKEPALNAWYDSKALGRRLFSEVHLGIAMDTPDGLFVPVIHHAAQFTAEALRHQIELLKKQVIDRSVQSERLKGASITLSNFGKFAGRYANPIVVPPMVAIIGVGKLREAVVPVQGEMQIAKVLPLALTFDHRAVTGGEAARFLGCVIESLESSH